ncbi:MAG: PP2C family protein-serine/threonine phosphatase [Sporichthyaceae bacterium]
MDDHSQAGVPDYARAINSFGRTAPGELTGLLDTVIAPMGGSQVAIYLADFAQLVLQPLLMAEAWHEQDWVAEDGAVQEQDIATTMAGRCFRTGAPVTAERDAGTRVWVPVVEHAERIGVLAMTLPSADPHALLRAAEVGRFVGLLVAGAARYTDMFHLRRRGRPMSVAAGMQWDLLPAITLRGPSVVSSGMLEPAYEVAGDAFDHALNGDWLHAALFDGMGHDLPATLMTTVAVGAFRHGRRSGLDLAEVADAVDAAVAAHCEGRGFVTGLLLRLHLPTGRLEWTCAGHPRPLLMRGQRVVGELTCPRAVPFGIRGAAAAVHSEALQPGDSLLMFTDGVVEGSPGDEGLGEERLADLWARETQDGRPPEEVTRRLTQAVLEQQNGTLHDDATVLLVEWRGPR